MKCLTASAILRDLKKALRPGLELSLTEWADTYRRLPASSENSGRWKTSNTPYMIEIMNSISNPRVERIVMMTSAQVGKSELLNNTCFYFAHQNPTPQLMVMPTIQLAENYSKERLQPTIDATPELCEIFGEKKSRSTENTILQKMFPGGFICLAGSNSPASLASRAVGLVLLDEVDRFPQSSGGEGDVISLAIKRTNTYRNRKIIIVSTPTDASTSRISSAYKNSTQEKYMLFCPSCNHKQQIVHDSIVVTEKENNVPKKVMGACTECGELSSEYDWKRKIGTWVATAKHHNTRGFHLNEWVSPWKNWLEIEREYEEAKQDVEKLRVWVNTSAGEVYEDKGEVLIWEEIARRAYLWDHPVPSGIIYLTAGVDTQMDRLAFEILGHTATGEDFSLNYTHILGDTNKKTVWLELNELLFKEFKTQDGITLKVSAVCVDSGGHSTQTVYEHCKKFANLGFMAIKGRGGWGVPFTAKPRKVKLKRGGTVNLFTLGVDDGKVRILRRLQNAEKGINYSHFPADREDAFFQELTAEKLASRMKQGRSVKQWVPVRKRNEALDCRNYAYAALELSKVDLESLHDSIYNEKEKEPEAPKPDTSKRVKVKRKKSYLDL